MSPPQTSPPSAMQELFISVQRLSLRDLETFSQQVSLFYAQRKTPHLSKKESELLQKINQGLPKTIWDPYKQLVAKRRNGTLTPDEHKMLIHFSNQLEEMNAERMGYLVELAQLWQQPLRKVMDKLGIYPLDHE